MLGVVLGEKLGGVFSGPVILGFAGRVEGVLFLMVLDEVDRIRCNLKLLEPFGGLFGEEGCFSKGVTLEKLVGNRAGLFAPRLYLVG